MKTKLLSLSFLLFLSFLSFGQNGEIDQDLSQARQMAENGRHSEAEVIYNRILRENPNNLPALVGAGYNYSWARRYDDARLKFETAISLDAASAEALSGLGYNYAWSGNYELARRSFERLQTAKPDSPEGPKGLGYVALWQGLGRQAEQYFLDLALKYPTVKEYRIALAQSYLVKHEVKNARIALRSALQLDSADRTANDLLKSTFGVAAPLEFDLWAGYSSTEGESKFSLRTLQLTGQVSQNVRMYLKYDNSLTSDLAALVRANQEAQALSLGGVVNWSKSLATRLEAGARILPDNVTQQILNGEQVFFFSNGMLLKAGGFYGWSNKVDDEWLVYGGFRVPVTRWYALEPYYFRSQVENAPRPESRFMLNNQFRSPGGYELNLGLFYGKAGVDKDVPDNKILGGYATAIFPFSQVIWGQLSLRWEETPFADLTVLSGGIKLRLEK